MFSGTRRCVTIVVGVVALTPLLSLEQARGQCPGGSRQNRQQPTGRPVALQQQLATMQSALLRQNQAPLPTAVQQQTALQTAVQQQMQMQNSSLSPLIQQQQQTVLQTALKQQAAWLTALQQQQTSLTAVQQQQLLWLMQQQNAFLIAMQQQQNAASPQSVAVQGSGTR